LIIKTEGSVEIVMMLSYEQVKELLSQMQPGDVASLSIGEPQMNINYVRAAI
jgi:hypothetical protein